ncbi:hypothetical protein Bra5_CH00528 [Rhizobium phaseoli Brasil 5]|nr:hypothetical protein Bra5_CH00528 [Rhizobium phaseoli Brasil 5]
MLRGCRITAGWLRCGAMRHVRRDAALLRPDSQSVKPFSRQPSYLREIGRNEGPARSRPGLHAIGGGRSPVLTAGMPR